MVISKAHGKQKQQQLGEESISSKLAAAKTTRWGCSTSQEKKEPEVKLLVLIFGLVCKIEFTKLDFRFMHAMAFTGCLPVVI